MTKAEKDKPSTKALVAKRKEDEPKQHIVHSIKEHQYFQSGRHKHKFNKATLTEGQKDEIFTYSQAGFICVDPVFKFWLPGTFRGRKRLGGRVKGTRNKFSDVADILADMGCNPVKGLALLAMNKKNDPALRAKCYSELLQYTKPKIKAIDRDTGRSGEDNTLTVHVISEEKAEVFDEAEIVPYEEDGLKNESAPAGDPGDMTEEDWELVAQKS